MEIVRSIYGYPPELYDCSKRTANEWKERGEQWPLLGVYLILGGCVYITMYSACLYAMYNLKLLKTSCYKIMFTLGFADIANLCFNSIIIGYLAVTGSVFCTCPFLMYWIGACNTFSWFLACILNMILAVNRACCMMEIRIVGRMFDAFGGLCWLIFASLYAFIGGFLFKPMPFNSKIFAGVFTPLIGDDIQAEIHTYENPFHPFNNTLTFVVIFAAYSIMCVVLLFKRGQLDSTDKRVYLQVFVISVPMGTASLLYMILQYINVPRWVIVIAHLAWQHCTGLASIVYLTMNTEIRGYYRVSREIRVTYTSSGNMSDKKSSPNVHSGTSVI